MKVKSGFYELKVEV